MKSNRSRYLKNALSITALLLSLAALQCPLWLPAVATRTVTAKAGATVFFEYEGRLAKASILQSRTASLSAAGPYKLAIHAHTPGRTCMIIHYKDGRSRLYEVVVLPG
jgi:hypothetical protein